MLKEVSIVALGLLFAPIGTRGSHHAERIVSHGLVLRQYLLAPFVSQWHVALVGTHLCAAPEHHVRSALGVLDVVARRRDVHDGHHLALRVKRSLSCTGVGCVEVC